MGREFEDQQKKIPIQSFHASLLHLSTMMKRKKGGGEFPYESLLKPFLAVLSR